MGSPFIDFTASTIHLYPWLNLIELNNSNGIWDKYNIAGSGGCSYLLDKEGTIIAIHPDANQLEKILSELFN